MSLPARIALVGFMCSGKTTVGRILASRLGYAFIDTDAEVERRAGTPVDAIFRERGEAGFRDLEAGVIASLAGRARIVIAAGGGAPVQERNRAFLSRDARTFSLIVSLAAARRRAHGAALRPLLAQDDETVRRLYEERLSLYAQVGTPVETEGRTPREVTEEIIGLLGGPTR
jgi:shikimate kinase